MTMHASKGLEFPVVALSGVGEMPVTGDDLVEEARVFYVAATRATNLLLMPLAGQAAFQEAFVGRSS
jgi:superfamily I DNA/RNA helicase